MFPSNLRDIRPHRPCLVAPLLMQMMSEGNGPFPIVTTEEANLIVQILQYRKALFTFLSECVSSVFFPPYRPFVLSYIAIETPFDAINNFCFCATLQILNTARWGRDSFEGAVKHRLQRRVSIIDMRIDCRKGVSVLCKATAMFPYDMLSFKYL